MSVFEIGAGQLSGGQLQLFAWGSEGLSSCWKTGANANADYFEWTKWTPFDIDSFLGLNPTTAARQDNGSRPGATVFLVACSRLCNN